jgi:hypothetical protein
VTSITGYVSAEACEAAGAALSREDARARSHQDAKRPPGEPDRYFVQIAPRCILGPVMRGFRFCDHHASSPAPLFARAIPLEGSWFGDAKDYLSMTVNVAVQKIGNVTDSSEG